MKTEIKGIILAGGSNSRLYPTTRAVSKQLLPVYDKPMFFYPLCTLMEAGIRDVLIIVRPGEILRFAQALPAADWLGMNICYHEQGEPKGLADAFLIADRAKFSNAHSRLCLILGDNLFHGPDIGPFLREATQASEAVIFITEVADPQRYGVVRWENDQVVEIIEKPATPPSRWAVTGLYCYPPLVTSIAKDLKPSKRGELEITDVNNQFIRLEALQARQLLPGNAWLDMGSPDALIQAGHYVQTVQQRQGVLIGSPEETAFRQGFISVATISGLAKHCPNAYGEHLERSLSLLVDRLQPGKPCSS